MNNPAILKNHLYSAKLCKHLYGNSKKNAIIRYNKTQKNLYVVLQGTNTPSHWLHNFSLFLTRDEGIHTGFKKYSELCQDELMNDILMYHCLRDIKSFDEIKGVYFTAHSLGASAVLILVYELLKQKFFDIEHIANMHIELVLFGSPKCGNHYFIDQFNELIQKYDNVRIYRYNVKYDIIQHYPPIMMYSHVCEGIVLENEKMELKQVFYNHSIQGYIKHLRDYYLEIRKNNYSDLKIHENM